MQEAKDAHDAGSQIHHDLQRLRMDSFHGKVVVVGRSNGAAGLFGYFAWRQFGLYGSDYPISRFISLDAPVGFNAALLAGFLGWAVVAGWAQWAYYNMPGAMVCIARRHIHGM